MNYEVWRHGSKTIMSETELRQWAVDYWRMIRDQANNVLSTIHDIKIDEVAELMESHELASIKTLPK